MKAQDLRIGNWVIGDKYWNGEDIPFQVNKLEDTDYGDLIKPIPLTQGWLDKFGFEDNKLNGFHIEYDNHAGYGIFYGGNFLTGVEYVHELQNLYFCIYAQELEIKWQK